jgi:hypothetical protein
VTFARHSPGGTSRGSPMSVSVHATRDAQVATPARCSCGNPSATLKWKRAARWSSGNSQRNAHVATSSRHGEQPQPPSVITVKHLGPCNSQLRRLGAQSSGRTCTSLAAASICMLTPTHRRCIDAVSCARHAGTTGCAARACAAALSCWMWKVASATRARRPTCGVIAMASNAVQATAVQDPACLLPSCTR